MLGREGANIDDPLPSLAAIVGALNLQHPDCDGATVASMLSEHEIHRAAARTRELRERGLVLHRVAGHVLDAGHEAAERRLRIDVAQDS